jgi:hypothetical protein
MESQTTRCHLYHFSRNKKERKKEKWFLLQEHGQAHKTFLQDVARFCQVLLALFGIIRYRESSKRHPDDPVPNGDFPELYCLGIRSSVSGIE